ncbi:MAG: helix-turn-helix domain-containing protein, partial [Syntrophothermus sp.]
RIRYYEKAGLINPARSRGNHRLFSDRDIERLRLVCELMSKGLTTRAVRLVWKKVRAFECDQIVPGSATAPPMVGGCAF